MMSLIPRRRETESPKPKACTSNSHYWVVTDASQRAVCGPHLHLMLGQMLIEHPHIASEDPEAGTLCEYLEVGRG